MGENMNIAMMRSSSMLEFLCPPPFEIREGNCMPCLALMPMLFSMSWFFSLTALLWFEFSPPKSYGLRPTEVFPLFWNAIAILVKTSLNPKCKRSAADYEL